MVASNRVELPDVAEFVGRLLQGVAREQQPLLVAAAERLAAGRYRRWARQIGDPERAARLRACADREEQIAERIEALYPDAGLLDKGPDLESASRSLFDGRPLSQQLALQAQGERLGAATWRRLAAGADEPARGSFLTCAELEEASASVLEAMLADGVQEDPR